MCLQICTYITGENINLENSNAEASVGKSNHFHVCTNVVRRRDQHFFIASYVRACIMALTDAEEYKFLALLAKQQH